MNQKKKENITRERTKNTPRGAMRCWCYIFFFFFFIQRPRLFLVFSLASSLWSFQENPSLRADERRPSFTDTPTPFMPYLSLLARARTHIYTRTLYPETRLCLASPPCSLPRAIFSFTPVFYLRAHSRTTSLHVSRSHLFFVFPRWAVLRANSLSLPASRLAHTHSSATLGLTFTEDLILSAFSSRAAVGKKTKRIMYDGARTLYSAIDVCIRRRYALHRARAYTRADAYCNNRPRIFELRGCKKIKKKETKNRSTEARMVKRGVYAPVDRSAFIILYYRSFTHKLCHIIIIITTLLLYFSFCFFLLLLLLILLLLLYYSM